MQWSRYLTQRNTLHQNGYFFFLIWCSICKMSVILLKPECVNSLAPCRIWFDFRWVIFKQILVTDVWVISCEITLRWVSQGLTDNKSTLVQVLAWCRQATSDYLNQCWPRSMSPYGVTRLQWVNTLRPKKMAAILKKSSIALSWQKMFAFWLKIHWILTRLHLTVSQHWFK